MDDKPTYEELENRVKELENQVTTELNVAERNKVELRTKLRMNILNTINKSENWHDSIEMIIGELKEFTGFEAVAIRLQEGEDYPYYVTKGFPAFFVKAEKYLCTRDQKGEIVRDSTGNPYVECMCGNVICGRTDASKVFFTEGGSFWSNNTTKLLSETTDEERQTRTRNRCNSEGYESVALIPLNAGDKTLGLIQFNDMRTDRFTKDEIIYFEEIGSIIGVAFARKQAEENKENLIAELNIALDEVKTLRGIIPICAYCKKIRDDEGVWDIMEAYICEHSDAKFSHGICPDCDRMEKDD